MKKQQKTRRCYPGDIKRDTVDLVDKYGYTQAAAARSLGIRPYLTGRWRREFQDQQREGGVPKDDMEELSKLRRENRALPFVMLRPSSSRQPTSNGFGLTSRGGRLTVRF